MVNINNESSENNNELTENLENTIQNETSEKLLSTIAENVWGYYQENKQSLKGKSLEEIFFAYVENDKEIIEQVRLQSGKELTFDDIKHLYLKTHYTLEESLTKNIFKNFKQKNAIKSVIKTFQIKLKNKGFDINFDNFLQNEIKSDKDIDEIFKNIRNYLHNKLKNLSAKEKNEIKNTKITNEDIVKQLINDGIIKDASYLEKNIGELKEQADEEMENILNIQSTLLNANIINNINEIEKGFDNLKQDLDKINGFGPLSEKLKKYDINKITEDEINKIYKILINENKADKLDENIEDEYINKINEIKKEKVLTALSKDIYLYLDYIKNHEEENNEKGLSGILRKIINNEPLTDKEKKLIINLFKKSYIKNVVGIVSKGFNLKNNQKEIYEKILNQLLDPNKDSLELPNNININNIEKTIERPEKIEDINDLFNIEPTIIFEITGDNNIEYFRHVFPEYFTKIEDRYYPIFSKVQITDTSGNKYTGYIKETISEDGTSQIEIYENNPIDNDIEPIKVTDKDDINQIELKEENKLKLDSRSDLRKLVLGMVSYFPEHKKDYNYYKLQKSIDEEKANNQNNKIDNINENTDNKINVENFKKEWTRLEGDENVEFKIGTTMQIKGKALNYPGITSNWFYAEITNINETIGYFTIKLHGGGLLNLDKEGEELQVPMIAKLLTKMKFEYGGNILKFNKINNIQDFGTNLKNISLKSDFQGLQQGLSFWSNNVEVKDDKLVRKNEKGEYEEIKYIGNVLNLGINNLSEVRSNKPINEKFNAWEIDIQKDYVILKYPYDKNFSRKLDLNTFLMLIMQNKLEPWTEKDFKTAEDNVSYNPQSNENKLKFFSFSNVVLSFKQLKESFSYYFKEDDELRAAEMYAKMAGTLPNFWFFSDIKMEAGGEKEAKIWKIIENAKSRLERAGEGKGANHGKIAAGIIKKEIFEKVKEGKELNYRTRLKAAGYLTYALEKGPGPYFRALADYEGKGYWVRALLGEDHYRKWLSRTKQLQEQLIKDPGNETIRDELIKSEVFYIKDVDECSSMYTANFGSTIEGLTINSVYSGGKVQNAYEGESSKSNYFMIRTGLKSYILNNRPANSLGALKAITELIETDDNYVDYYSIIISIISTGYIFNNYNSGLAGQFNKICKTYGIPIGLFAQDQNGLKKVLTIMDYIVKRKGIKFDGKDSFTEYLYGVKDPNKVDIFSIRTKKERKNIIEKIEKFWKLHGQEVVNALDHTDTTLIKAFSDKKIDKNEKQAIGEYFSKVNDNIVEDFSFNDELFKTAYSPYYKNGIFNVPAGPFQHIALEIDDGKFEGKNRTIAEGVWKSISWKLEGMEDIMDNDEVYEFLIKKFMNWFGRFYKGEKETELIQALKSGDSKKLDTIIIDFNRQNYGDNGKIPPEMRDGLAQFSKCFQKRPNNINKILSDIFGKDKV